MEGRGRNPTQREMIKKSIKDGKSLQTKGLGNQGNGKCPPPLPSQVWQEARPVKEGTFQWSMKASNNDSLGMSAD